MARIAMGRCGGGGIGNGDGEQQGVLFFRKRKAWSRWNVLVLRVFYILIIEV